MSKTMPNKVHAFIDLDGTMFHGSQAIDGADRLIECLQKWKVPYLFVTNNSTRTPQQIAALMGEMGIQARTEDVLTSAQAAAMFIRDHYTDPFVFMIGEEGLQQALSDCNIRWTNDPLVAEQKQIDVVVQGLDRQFTYKKLEAASIAIRKGAVSIVTNPDVQLPSDKGISPGAGTIAAAIQAASGVEPVCIGKPEAIIMQVALKQLECTASEAIVVGDNLLTDIQAGIRAKCLTALVLTGVTSKSSYASYRESSNDLPDYVFDNLEQVRLLFEQIHENNDTERALE
ncbi:HAD-IIA family hydrolase [Paenibacillus sp. SC116]|uniref:HAD-IIA family hydrolase n=1 Tax=Paenibacillus sp. SC116 TaxID=2968986 RepID=UPI00215A1FA6|nr:HAD-IIA family hydrolase [Paenibacillus sp. SC116]